MSSSLHKEIHELSEMELSDLKECNVRVWSHILPPGISRKMLCNGQYRYFRRWKLPQEMKIGEMIYCQQQCKSPGIDRFRILLEKTDDGLVEYAELSS